MSDRIELLREMLLQPLQAGMRDVAVGSVAGMDGDQAELRARLIDGPDASSFRVGAWHGYKLAFGIFERWLSMTGKCTVGGRFAVHSNPADGLRDGPVEIGDWARAGNNWTKEKEDGSSCNGTTEAK